MWLFITDEGHARDHSYVGLSCPVPECHVAHTSGLLLKTSMKTLPIRSVFFGSSIPITALANCSRAHAHNVLVYPLFEKRGVVSNSPSLNKALSTRYRFSITYRPRTSAAATVDTPPTIRDTRPLSPTASRIRLVCSESSAFGDQSTRPYKLKKKVANY